MSDLNPKSFFLAFGGSGQSLQGYFAVTSCPGGPFIILEPFLNSENQLEHLKKIINAKKIFVESINHLVRLLLNIG